MKLFPSDLNNQYKGSKFVQYGLYPIFAIYIFRSLIHFLAENSGLVGIFDHYTLSDDGTRVIMPVGSDEIIIDQIN